MKYLKRKGIGEIHGDCTSSVYFELKGDPTVKQLCDDILTNVNEWGYIGIAEKTGGLFGDPHIQYFNGKYVDANRHLIDFNLPEEIANSKVRDVEANGGWSRMDYLLYLEK